MGLAMNTPVLVVGATGLVGGRVARLLAQHRPVRALLRPGSDGSDLLNAGITCVSGDLTRPETLLPAVAGVGTVVTTAYGYGRRRPGDSLTSVDDLGNAALIAAAARAGVQRFVFTSILACDKAVDVPHFHQKYRTEQILAASGMPYTVLRPGGFIDTLLGFQESSLRKGRFPALTDPDAPASTIPSWEVARLLAAAVEHPEAAGRCIDIACAEPTTLRRITSMLSIAMGRPIALRTMPNWMSSILLRGLALMDSRMRGMDAAMRFIASGLYVADTHEQTRMFGPIETLESAIVRWVTTRGLNPAASATHEHSRGRDPRYRG